MMNHEEITTVRALVRKAAELYGNTPYLRTYRDGEFIDISFHEFSKRCDAVSAWVAGLTRRKGHQLRIAAISPNSVEYATTILGIMCSGAVIIPLDVQIREKQLCRCLNKAEADYLILDNSMNIDVNAVMEKCSTVEQVFQLEYFEAMVSGDTGCADLLDVRQENCAAILFTSGTTGGEKGVMLSNRNITDNAMNTVHEQRYIKVSSLPLHHCFGLCCDILMSLVNGSVVCIRGGADKLAENLLLFQPTLIHVVPLSAQVLLGQLRQIAARESQPDMQCKNKVFGSRLQYLVSGGAPLPGDVYEAYRKLEISIAQAYGMSECAPLISYPDLLKYQGTDGRTVGTVVLRCKNRIVDEELQVNSPSVMMGYVNDPDLTAEAFSDDGWLRTGDIGYVNEGGYLYITGRKKNLIILSNGENVSPEQIEKALMDYPLVEECLVYGEGTNIVAEIYPNSKYAAMHGIGDIPAAIGEIVREVNAELPSYKKVMKHLIRLVPLEKTSTNKIARNQRAGSDIILQTESAVYAEPETDLQQKLFDCTADVLNHREFGVETDIFSVGMDSLSSMSLLTALSEELDFNINLDELMTARTVRKLEQLYTEKKEKTSIDYSVRMEYPLTDIQKYLIFSACDNTTGNVPALFRLDRKIDTARLQESIQRLFRLHPILNNRIDTTNRDYMNSRDDNRPVYLPEISMSREEWEQNRDGVVRPYSYGLDEPMYHIELYRVEEDTYFLFDISHVISDGTTLNILLEDLNRIYAGEEAEPEKHSFYEYLLEEASEEKDGQRMRNSAYFAELMDGMRIDRSMFVRKDAQNAEVVQAVLKTELSCINREQLLEFGRKHGVSENTFFLTAFNYCISLYSGKQDTVSTSIHNGRTDNRWSRIAGCLFATYSFRSRFDLSKSVIGQLKENGGQIMETMRRECSSMQLDEMFFLFQSDLLEFDQIGGLPAEKISVQLDSFPFHLLVYAGENSYRYELRYWKNRLDESLLKQFLQVFDAVLGSMLTAQTFTDVFTSLPECVFPNAYSAQALDSAGRVLPFGAWGDLHENGISTGRCARVMPDGSVDDLESCGRTVMQEGVMKRSFLDLHKLEQTLLEYPDVRNAHAYVFVGAKNVPMLAAEVDVVNPVKQLTLMKFLKEKKLRNLMPSKFIINHISE